MSTDPKFSENCALENSAKVRSKGGNLIGLGGSCSFGSKDLLGVDPLLKPRADNGGPTLPNALSTGYPGIDLVIAEEATRSDQRGVRRGPQPDSGAFEVR